MRDMPANHTGVAFYTLAAGLKDQVACATSTYWTGCDLAAKFAGTSANLKAQINVGAGSDASKVDYDWKDGMPYNQGGGDTSNGVGHFRAKSNTGAIIQRMLLTTCSGIDCALNYTTGPKIAY